MKKVLCLVLLLAVMIFALTACDAGDIAGIIDSVTGSGESGEKPSEQQGTPGTTEEPQNPSDPSTHICEESDWIVDIAPACLTTGLHHTQCLTCQKVIRLEQMPAIGHDFTEYEIMIPATCTDNAVKIATCSRCTATDTVVVAGSSLGHEFVDYVSDGNATCTEDGTKTARCTRCTVTDTKPDNGSAGHRFSTEWSYDANFHWHAALCGHTELETINRHTFVDGVCTACGYEQYVRPTVVPGETVESDVDCVNPAWTEQQLLIMNVSDCSNGGEMQAGGRGYVSGNNKYTAESAHITNSLLKDVIQRNSDAAAYANVNMAYSYSNWGWGEATGTIGKNIGSGVSGMPDIYYDSVYDMVASSIKGHFLNVLENEYYHGAGKNAAAGYNRDYMDVMTFSTKAEYLIASDFSVDISRNFYLLPVNMNILTAKAALVVDDRNNDCVIDVADFFDIIDDEEWTWDFIAHLCEAVKVESYEGGYNINDGTVGMAIDGKTGLVAAGLCYASELQIITRDKNAAGEYVYTYETEGAALSQVSTTLANSISKTDGFILHNSADGYASVTEAIAHAFAEDHVLIGNVILLGAIEQDVYREMWDEENDRLGFVCAPMPLYNKGTAGEWTYHTVVHNLAKVFGIVTTAREKLDRALAFLDYASTHSTQILEDFYTWTILYDAVNGDPHNVEYLINMKENMGGNLDMIVDDALGAVGGTYAKGEINYYSNRWHLILRDGQNGAQDDGYGIGAGIVSVYKGLYKAKEDAVKKIQAQFLSVAQ